jgi:hypothetical protein
MKRRSSRLLLVLPLLCVVAQISVPAQTDKVDEYIQGEMKTLRCDPGPTFHDGSGDEELPGSQLGVRR